jgi:hypothetical protein
MAKRLTKAIRESIREQIESSARSNTRCSVQADDLLTLAPVVQEVFRLSVQSVCDSATSEREHADYTDGLGRPLTSAEADAIRDELFTEGF